MSYPAVGVVVAVLWAAALCSTTTPGTRRTGQTGPTLTTPAPPHQPNRTQGSNETAPVGPIQASTVRPQGSSRDPPSGSTSSANVGRVTRSGPLELNQSVTTGPTPESTVKDREGYVTTSGPDGPGDSSTRGARGEPLHPAQTTQEQLTTSAPSEIELTTSSSTSQNELSVSTAASENEQTTSGVDIYPCGAVSFRQKFVTGCSICYVTRSFGCPSGFTFLRERACNRDHFCLFECEVNITYPQCCPGRWGPDCRPCPGGVAEVTGGGTGLMANLTSAVTNVCSDHGTCSEGLRGDGSCRCEKGFSGSACEQCAGVGVYGVGCNMTCDCVNGTCDAGVQGMGGCDCDIDYQGDHCDQLAPCNQSLCGDNARCEDDHGQTCVCLRGYVGDGQNCTLRDVCNDGFDRCHPHALCNQTAPAEYTCTCKPGYAGDGFACEAIDPCQDLEDPVCPTNSTSCTYKGPGQHECKCLPGFANLTQGAGCEMRDLCLEGAHSCNKHANCTMQGPNEYECTCLEGFVGNGYLCRGNILQVLDDLNSAGRFKNSLNSVREFYQFALGEFLESARYLTVFVPTDDAFRQHDWRSWMADWAGASQTVKHHILPVARSLNQLVNGSLFYTLEGTAADITYSRKKKTVRYRLLKHAYNTKAKVLRGNIAASNGIIHVMNKLINKPPVIGYKKRQTLCDQIEHDGRYNRLETLLSLTGLRDLLNSTTTNMTVFAPNNKAWDNLEDGVLTFLQAPEGRAKLVTLLKNHVVLGNHFSFDMLAHRRLRTLSNNVLELSVSPRGRLLLNGETNGISQTDIPAANGLYHHVNDVLIPESIRPILTRRCDVQEEQTVRGACSSCQSAPRCAASSDTLLPVGRTRCLLVRANQGSRSVAMIGCRPRCKRTVTVKKCCKNFYGPSCDPCPLGHLNPCGGRGGCNDTVEGNGQCVCEDTYAGPLCDRCRDPARYGPGCGRNCTCLHGDCDTGVQSKGHCKTGTCRTGYTGEDCHLRTDRCGTVRSLCHAHAYCSLVNTTRPLRPPLTTIQPLLPPLSRPRSLRDRPRNLREYIQRRFVNLAFVLRRHTGMKCRCMSGYEGDGHVCTPVNPCLSADRGGCHLDATCGYTAPGENTCQCNRGWVGDGKYCYPSTPCLHHAHCHRDALCERTAPGHNECVCKANFHGNGTYCVPDNVCEVQNGGCSPLATCTPLGPGNRSCACPASYGGNGITCIGSLWQELQMRDGLQLFQGLLQNTSLPDVLSDLSTHYTVFAPNDSVLQQGCSHPPTTLADLQYYIVHAHYNLDQLQTRVHISTTSSTAFLPTLLEVGGRAKELKVSYTDELTVNSARIIDRNGLALNGIFHIIDSCLEPTVPSGSLAGLLEHLDMFSNFTASLKVSGVLNEIDSLDSYTLFVLDNAHWRSNTLDGGALQQYLSYYVVPRKVMLDSLLPFQQVETLLGISPSSVLNITTNGHKAYVNGYIVYDDRLRSTTGAVYRLSHALNPNLNRCDAIDDNRQYQRECCPGYYGYTCQPCPGGSKTPCNDHGRCNSGIAGTGACDCLEGYTGPSCDICEDTHLAKGNKCEINHCFFCDQNAECVHRGNTTHCRCAVGYRGDGIQCTHVCMVDNGGCDPNATCSVSAMTDRVSCQCELGFYGNGINCTQITSLLQTVATLQDAQDFYNLLSLVSGTGQPEEDVKNMLVDQNQNLTLLLPVNWAGNASLNETNVDVLRHVVTKYFELNADIFENNDTEYLTLSGDKVKVSYLESEGIYTVNNSRVLRMNIPATNGIVHVIETPLRPPPITAALTSETTFNTMAIVIGCIAVALILLIIVIALVIWKWNRRCSQTEKNQPGSGFKFLILDDKDEYKDVGILDASSTYQNPLYDHLESSGLTEENLWQ